MVEYVHLLCGVCVLLAASVLLGWLFLRATGAPERGVPGTMAEVEWPGERPGFQWVQGRDVAVVGNAPLSVQDADGIRDAVFVIV